MNFLFCCSLLLSIYGDYRKTKANIKANRKYKSKVIAKEKTKIESKCKNKNKVGLPPNKLQVLRLQSDSTHSSN